LPYKDSEQKREWERLHRSKRIARRRALRQAEVARLEAYPEASRPQVGTGGLLLPVGIGVTLAAYNPKLAMATGGLTLAGAILLKRGRRWWIFGILVLVIGLFCQWNEQVGRE
jgi:hypothetical protein